MIALYLAHNTNPSICCLDHGDIIASIPYSCCALPCVSLNETYHRRFLETKKE